MENLPACWPIADVSDKGLGLLVAVVLPGFVALTGLPVVPVLLQHTDRRDLGLWSPPTCRNRSAACRSGRPGRVILCIVLLAGSRDTLAKYYSKVEPIDQFGRGERCERQCHD